jgi:type II secretory ATPase GspE/PulE/Tfp pilus assembly ATPase PilB-like protein
MLRPAGGEGVVLVTGPANSGKTTTAYSMVYALDDGHRNIVTIEDPPEYHIPSFRQLAADERHGVTMTSGLRTLLRMDPDIVLVGEIRDVEAAQIAMRAASSGKFVFTTLHTRDVASTLTALRDLHVDNRSLAGNLTGIVSQRLVRRLCPRCRREAALDADSARLFADEGLEPPERVLAPAGCEACRQTGYFERIGIFEVVVPDREFRAAIESGASEDELRSVIRSQGTTSLRSDALLKVQSGATSLDELRAMTWARLPENQSSTER